MRSGAGKAADNGGSGRRRRSSAESSILAPSKRTILIAIHNFRPHSQVGHIQNTSSIFSVACSI